MIQKSITNKSHFKKMIVNMVDAIIDNEEEINIPINELDIELILKHFEEQNSKCANCSIQCGNSICSER